MPDILKTIAELQASFEKVSLREKEVVRLVEHMKKLPVEIFVWFVTRIFQVNK